MRHDRNNAVCGTRDRGTNHPINNGKPNGSYSIQEPFGECSSVSNMGGHHSKRIRLELKGYHRSMSTQCDCRNVAVTFDSSANDFKRVETRLKKNECYNYLDQCVVKVSFHGKLYPDPKKGDIPCSENQRQMSYIHNHDRRVWVVLQRKDVLFVRLPLHLLQLNIAQIGRLEKMNLEHSYQVSNKFHPPSLVDAKLRCFAYIPTKKEFFMVEVKHRPDVRLKIWSSELSKWKSIKFTDSEKENSNGLIINKANQSGLAACEIDGSIYMDYGRRWGRKLLGNIISKDVRKICVLRKIEEYTQGMLWFALQNNSSDNGTRLFKWDKNASWVEYGGEDCPKLKNEIRVMIANGPMIKMRHKGMGPRKKRNLCFDWDQLKNDFMPPTMMDNMNPMSVDKGITSYYLNHLGWLANKSCTGGRLTKIAKTVLEKREKEHAEMKGVFSHIRGNVGRVLRRHGLELFYHNKAKLILQENMATRFHKDDSINHHPSSYIMSLIVGQFGGGELCIPSLGVVMDTKMLRLPANNSFGIANVLFKHTDLLHGINRIMSKQGRQMLMARKQNGGSSRVFIGVTNCVLKNLKVASTAGNDKDHNNDEALCSSVVDRGGLRFGKDTDSVGQGRMHAAK